MNDRMAERERREETIRLVVTRREQAPRSPKMERALKRLIWRYVRLGQFEQRSVDVQK
jgi:hypothetical protein